MRRTLFWVRYFFSNVLLAFKLIFRGEARRVFHSSYARVYKAVYSLLFRLRMPRLRADSPKAPDGTISVATSHPVAYSSPDHVAPFGTMYDNSTNRKFVMHMNEVIASQFKTGPRSFMDLGCSGGQLVADFKDIGWTAVGLEGSDYSLKHKRANWATLANRNLFTCDITKPFQVMFDQKPLRFHLITAWEVLEHIHTSDLPQLFENISKHLTEGGIFIASTASGSSTMNGVELHQTQWTNDQWQRFLAERIPTMTPTDVGLKIHQYVRYDFGDPSFLVYKRKDVSRSPAQSMQQQAVPQSRP